MLDEKGRKVNDSKALTNTGKAQDLLKKYKLWGSKKLEATPIVLKVLFGKEGAIRLLRDSKVTRDSVSLFNRMAESVEASYIRLKLENLNAKNNEAEEEIKKCLDDFERYLSASSSGGIEKLCDDYMKAKIKAGSLGKKINRFRDYAEFFNNLANGRKVLYGNGSSYQMFVWRVKNDIAWRIQSQMTKIARLLSEKASILESTQESDVRGQEDTYKHLFVKIDEYVKTMKEIIKEKGEVDRSLEKGLEEFCKLCNKQGLAYYNNKKVNVFTLRTDLVKKETARLLAVLAPPEPAN